MFYAAVPDPDSAFIMTATSRDEGLPWEKAPEPAVRPAAILTDVCVALPNQWRCVDITGGARRSVGSGQEL